MSTSQGRASPTHILQPPPNTHAWRRTRRKRFRAVVRLFASYIFDYWRIWVLSHVLGSAFTARMLPAMRRRQAIRYRETAIAQGGLLIKVGQFFSSRVDLLPAEYIDELAKLQDDVPSVAFPIVRAVAEQELGGPLADWFTWVDETAVAAASLGQVHRATLPTGEHIALKIQRPDIASIIAIDLDNFRWAMKWMRRLTSIAADVDWDGIFAEVAQTLDAELDYRVEAQSAIRFRQTFLSDTRVRVPAVFLSHSRQRVLALEYCDGIKITNYAELEAAGIDRTAVARILLETYFRQVFELDFFHADPHPGNLFVQPGPVVVFLDFGLMGTLSPAVRAAARRLLNAFVQRDPAAATTTLAEMGFLRQGANQKTVRDALGWFLDQFYRSSLVELAHISPHEVFDQVRGLIAEQPFQIPANYVFIGRTIGTLVGLSTGLAPNLNVIRVMEPYARKLAGEEVADWTELIGKQVKEYGQLALTLPRSLDRVLKRIDNGELDVRVTLINDLSRSVSQLERTARQLIWAALCAGLLIGGSVLVGQGQETRGDIAFAVAVLCGMLAVWPFNRRRPRR